jgi:hypothetical protein
MFPEQVVTLQLQKTIRQLPFMSPHNLCDHHLAVVIADPGRHPPKTLKGPRMPLPVTLRAFPLKGHHKKSIRVGQHHHEKPHLPHHPRNLHQRISKIHLRLSHPMDQRHEHLLLHPQDLPHRILHLGVLSPIAHLPQALINPLGRVTLFLRQGFVFFDDLCDPLKVGANLRLGAGLLQAISGRLRVGQDLL